MPCNGEYKSFPVMTERRVNPMWWCLFRGRLKQPINKEVGLVRLSRVFLILLATIIFLGSLSMVAFADTVGYPNLYLGYPGQNQTVYSSEWTNGYLIRSALVSWNIFTDGVSGGMRGGLQAYTGSSWTNVSIPGMGTFRTFSGVWATLPANTTKIRPDFRQ